LTLFLLQMQSYVCLGPKRTLCSVLHEMTRQVSDVEYEAFHVVSEPRCMSTWLDAIFAILFNDKAKLIKLVVSGRQLYHFGGRSGSYS